MDKLRRHTKKVFIGIIGGTVTLVGVVLIPYPGPGWLVVFAGLAILASEFQFAADLLDFARGKYDAWVDWLKRQHILVRVAVIAATGLVVVLTMWLLNVFSILNAMFSLGWPWLKSPLF